VSIEDYDVIIENSYELFILLLSNVQQGTELTTQMFQDFSKITQNAEAKEALAARVFVSQRVVEKLDECFKVIGDEPVKLSAPVPVTFEGQRSHVKDS
jgi:ferritin-like metal-binding protein YciE